MRKFYSFIGMMLTTLVAMAAPVDQETAMSTARAFLFQKNSTQSSMKQAPARQMLTAVPALEGFYAFNIGAEDGFVLVSGDDRTPSILGYADQGSFDLDKMPAQMKAWFAGYSEQISYIKRNPSAVAMRKINVKRSIAPLLKSTWGQAEPFNDKCPMFVTDVRSLTGCVATCMSQVMKYYEWPAATLDELPAYSCTTGYTMEFGADPIFVQVDGVPAGTTLDWANMLLDYSYSENATANAAVATLMHAAGASVGMEYRDATNGGSSTSNLRAVYALQHYFGYAESLAYVQRKNYTSEAWNEMVYQELQAKRPVMIGGNSSEGGHAFLIDGYSSDNYFHINWGWEGYCDGYYLLSICNPTDEEGPTMAGGYNFDQDALIGIQPKSSQPMEVAMLPMTGDIVKTGMAGDNNDVLRITCSYYSQLEGNNTFDTGIGIIQQDGTFKLIGEAFRTEKLVRQAGYGEIGFPVYTATQIPDEGLADGTYRVVPICKQSTETKWRCYLDYTRTYLEVTVNGSDIKANIIRPQVYLNVKDIHYLTAPMVGSQLWLEADVENLADEFYGPLYLYARTGSGDVLLVGIQGASLPAARTSTVTFSYIPTLASTYTLLISTSFTTTEQGDIIIEQDKVIGTYEITVAEKAGAAELEVTDFAFDTDSICETFEYEGATYAFSHYVMSGMLSGKFHIKNNGSSPFDGFLSILFLATDNLGSSFAVPGGSIGQLQGVEVPLYAYIEANSEKDVPFVLPGVLPMNWYYVPILYGQGTLLTNPQEFLNYRLIAKVIPGIVTYDAIGNVKSVPVEEDMTFEANVIAAEFSTTAIKSVDAKNPNMLFFFDANTAVPAAFTKNVVCGTEATSLEITDGYPFNTPYEFKAKAISFTRTFTPRLTKEGAGWETIALPFDVQRIESNGQALEWYRTEDAEDTNKFRLVEFDEEDGQNLIFKPASEMKAATAYLIGFPVAGGTEQKAVTFYGTDTNVSKTALQPNEYTGANFVLRPSMYQQTVDDALTLNAAGTAFVKADGKVEAFRGYVTKTALAEDFTSALISSTVNVAVSSIAPEANKQAAEWYTVNGQRIQRPAKTGIYVSNGKKVVVK